MFQPRSSSKLLLICAISLAGCADQPVLAPRVTEDEVLQARFQTALRTLEEVRDRKRRRLDIFADCQSLEMLLTRELRKLPAAPVRKLCEEVDSACQGVKAEEP